MPEASPLVQSVWEEIDHVEGFMEGASIFSNDDRDRAYFVDSRQVAMIEPDGRLALRLTRPVISQHRSRLKEDPRVDLRRSGSDWVLVDVRHESDREFVLELVELVAVAHWPEFGPLREPPEGADLARRRRFH